MSCITEEHNGVATGHRAPPPPLLALMGNATLRRRLRMAIDYGPASRVIGPTIFASGWRELRELVRRHDRSPAVVDLGFQTPADPPDACSVRVLRGTSVPLVTCARTNGVGRNGAEDPAPRGVCIAAAWRPTANDSNGTVTSDVLRAADVHTVNSLLAGVAKRMREEVEQIFSAVLAIAVRRSTVRELATALTRSQRSLRRHCTELCIPPPKRLLSLGRVFTVERLAEWSGQPAGAVALALGFSDYANYRRLVRNALADAASPVPHRVGLAYVRRFILQVLAANAGRRTR